MAHEIEIIGENASMFYMGETPWHGLGVKLDAPPTIEEGIKLAGLDWTVDRMPLQLADGTAVPSHFVNVRSSDKKQLGVVGKGYKALQNVDAFKWFQPYLDSGEVELHTAGCLREGKSVWILAQIKGTSTEIVKGDEIQEFILLSNAHDGTSAVRAGLTSQRVVCANTLAAAHNASSSKLLRVRHSEKAPAALDRIRDSLDLARREFSATCEAMRQMAKVGVDVSDIKQFVREVFEPKVTLGDAESVELTNTKLDNLSERVIELYETGRGSDIPGVKGTVWGMYNAVTELNTWSRGRNADNRLSNLWLGPGANLNQRAFEVAVKMAA